MYCTIWRISIWLALHEARAFGFDMTEGASACGRLTLVLNRDWSCSIAPVDSFLIMQGVRWGVALAMILSYLSSDREFSTLRMLGLWCSCFKPGYCWFILWKGPRLPSPVSSSVTVTHFVRRYRWDWARDSQKYWQEASPFPSDIFRYSADKRRKRPAINRSWNAVASSFHH